MFQSERVLLRAFTRDDVQRQWEFENNAKVWYLDGGPPRPASLEKMLAEYEEEVKKESDRLSFAIEVGGTYVGHCSLHTFQPVHRTCELSIEIGDPEYRGQGYGREVIGLLLDIAFRHRNLHKVFLVTHVKNERAVRCYRACGFVEEGRLRQQIYIGGEYVDQLYMGILREEWAAARS